MTLTGIHVIVIAEDDLTDEKRAPVRVIAEETNRPAHLKHPTRNPKLRGRSRWPITNAIDRNHWIGRGQSNSFSRHTPRHPRGSFRPYSDLGSDKTSSEYSSREQSSRPRSGAGITLTLVLALNPGPISVNGPALPLPCRCGPKEVIATRTEIAMERAIANTSTNASGRKG